MAAPDGCLTKAIRCPLAWKGALFDLALASRAGGKRSPGPRSSLSEGGHRGPGAIGCEPVPNRRETKRRLASGTAKYVVNPVVRGLFRLGLPAPGTAILETTGRKSGRPRRNPVTNGLDDGVFWIVAEHGRRASYVRNIEANPHVRLRIGRRWHEGTARLVPDDDPRERLRYIASRRPIARLNTATVRLMQTDLLTIRVELNGEEP